ncbi:MAG: IS1 family transposase [Leptolyngbya sp. SIO1E4]|nr:IS1 family transposase [Leptolyngbya sp. SIO1E4]
MATEVIRCPPCQGENVVKHGQSKDGKQRYKCRNSNFCVSSGFGQA